MENTDKSLFDISFDESVKQNLKGAATWGGIAAIVSLAGSILGLIKYFVQKGKIGRYSTSYEGTRISQAANAGGFVSVAIALIIGIILFVFLNKFANKSKAGVAASDQYLMNEGLGSLATYFKFVGVLIIIVIILCGLVVMVGIGSKV